MTDSLDNPGYASGKVRAAQYLRMSNEHQQYSPDNQAEAIGRYADENGYEIVATYCDEGKSGVTVNGRNGLQQLLGDVESGRSRFDAILVYDVSRWGRFQNPDEAAVYEFRCRVAGVPVHYCAEQFDNDDSVFSSLVKTLKRAMAAEYSRELSAKVTEGHRQMLARGFHQGGFPCFGLQRVLIGADGRRKQILRPGERKNLQSDRVILEPGAPEEVALVNEVYSRYLAGERQSVLLADLNRRGIQRAKGQPWTSAALFRMLTSECYIGNIVWGKHDGKLGRPRRSVESARWTRHEAVFPAIVEPTLFWKVQAEIERRKSKRSADEILDGLRHLLKKHGTLNKRLIDEAKGIASAPATARRFGSLKAAYAAVGFQPVWNNKYTKINKRVSALAARIGKDIAQRLGATQIQNSGPVSRLDLAGSSFVLLLGRHIDRMDGPPQWYVAWDQVEDATAIMVGLLNPGNTKIATYHALSRDGLIDLQNRKPREDGIALKRFVQPNLAECVVEVALQIDRSARRFASQPLGIAPGSPT